MATEQPRAVWCCSTCGAIYHKDFPRCPADGAEVVMAERDPLLGSAVGHYTIDKLIGEGGMGRVYLAHHATLPNKHYAFKVLLGDHSASIAMRQRFTREAERASQLDHPNVAKVVDFGQTKHGLLYIVMDYVEGPSLVSLIAEGPMRPARAIALGRAICKGLVYAHATGIVHRDLKPENILVAAGPDGEVPRIVDFGLALSVDQSDARLTESGMTMGTPAFAAPEQLSGKPIDHRADLYALGMTMFEMLTGGMAPFEGHVMEVVSARTTRDAPRISERAPEIAVPAELEDIIAKLTRRKPAERYANGREVIEALDAVRVGPEARIPTEPGLTLAPAWRRPLAWLAAVATVAVAFVAVAWFATGGDRRAGSVASPATASPPAAPSSVAPPGRPVAPPAPPPEVPGAVTSAVPGVPTDPAPSPSAPVVASRDAPATRGPAPGQPAKAHPAGSALEPRPLVRVEPAAAGEPVRAEPVPAAASPSGAAGPASPSAAQAPASGHEPAVLMPPNSTEPVVVRAPLRATLGSVEVTGSLPARDVKRAVGRRWAAVERCRPGAPEVVTVSFKIGDARRARGVQARGASPATASCVIAAFNEVQTEQAPDVGEVEVTVTIVFAGKT